MLNVFWFVLLQCNRYTLHLFEMIKKYQNLANFKKKKMAVCSQQNLVSDTDNIDIYNDWDGIKYLNKNRTTGNHTTILLKNGNSQILKKMTRALIAYIQNECVIQRKKNYNIVEWKKSLWQKQGRFTRFWYIGIVFSFFFFWKLVLISSEFVKELQWPNFQWQIYCFQTSYFI